ncbi:MAG TPA: DUF169 domain-containing protein [Patescibacteria group bacterium]|nr:DUF169 domain-containing protein [Patescibacteria group bacterium]
MSNYREMDQIFSIVLGPDRRAVAVAFRESVPLGVEKFSGSQPSGCSYWRLAAAGRVFCTVAADHYNCAIGSYTHNIELPEERAPELDQTLALMAGIGYLKMEEVPMIPRLQQAPAVVVYAPLRDTPVDPDVVLLMAPPGRIMLIQEAAQRAGVRTGAPLLGRPTCMSIPAAMAGGFVVSTGCIGNRVYTDLREDDLYAVIPARDLAKIAGALETIAAANSVLLEYHRGRRRELATE